MFSSVDFSFVLWGWRNAIFLVFLDIKDALAIFVGGKRIHSAIVAVCTDKDGACMLQTGELSP